MQDRFYFRITLLYCIVLFGLFSSCGSLRKAKTAALGNPNDLRILLISDLNGSYGSVDYSEEVDYAMDRLQEIDPDIVLCAGDMVAGQKASLSRPRLDSMWSAFNQNVLQRMDSLNIPFGFTMGNHDAAPNFLQDRAAAETFWKAHLPKTNLNMVDSSHYPFYFSYEQQGVFFMSWDASAAWVPEEVMRWMQKQLSAPLAKKARMRIVLGHLPLYALVEAKNKPGEVNAKADAALEFFQENGVDMYISGHQHAYFPGKKQDVVLFNSGCLGGGPRVLLGDKRPPMKAYSIIDLSEQSDIRIHTVNPSTGEDIALQSLPESVRGFNGVLQRIDLFEPQ